MISAAAAACAACSVAALTAGCAGTFESRPVTPFGTPYEKLNADSYGPRSMSGYRPCDPNDSAGSQVVRGQTTQDWVHGFAYNVASAMAMGVGAPMQGALKVDATVQTLDLLKHFRIPGDSNHPTVAVLSYDAEHIVFWHEGKPVRLPELFEAAGAYCKTKRRTALYRGSASRCPPPQAGLGGQAVVGTHAISAWACTP